MICWRTVVKIGAENKNENLGVPCGHGQKTSFSTPRKHVLPSNATLEQDATRLRRSLTLAMVGPVMRTMDGTTFVAVVRVTTIADGSEIVGMGAIHPNRLPPAAAFGRAKQTHSKMSTLLR